MQKVSRFCGGLILFLAVVTPVTRWELTGKLQDFQAYYELLEHSQDAVEAGNEVLEEEVCRKTALCIQRQAEELGAEVTVSVICEKQQSIPIPASVTVYGTLTPAQQKKLTRWLKEGLRLTSKQIRYGARGIP